MKILMNIGGFMAIAGIASIVMSFFDYNLKILLWIDMWGPTVGWVIRIALIVVGALLYFVGRAGSND